MSPPPDCPDEPLPFCSVILRSLFVIGRFLDASLHYLRWHGNGAQLRIRGPSREDMTQDEILHRNGFDGPLRDEARFARNDQRTIRVIGGDAAMRAFDQARIERDDIHQSRESKCAAGKAPSDRKLWETDGRVEKQFDR